MLPAIKALSERLRNWTDAVERALSKVRAWVEHPLNIAKNLFRHKKLRHRGLAVSFPYVVQPVPAERS